MHHQIQTKDYIKQPIIISFMELFAHFKTYCADNSILIRAKSRTKRLTSHIFEVWASIEKQRATIE